jgi:hypothetical protein
MSDRFWPTGDVQFEPKQSSIDCHKGPISWPLTPQGRGRGGEQFG